MVNDNAEGLLFQNHLFRLRALSMSPLFTLLWMNSHHVQRYWVRTCATSSGLNTINRKMLNAAPVFVPSTKEQTRIAEAVAVSRDRIASEVRRLDKLRDQRLGLMQDLLTGRVPVKFADTAAVPA